jgi:hypothetical protein
MVTHKTIYSGETFVCPVCNRTYVWSWNFETDTFSFRCVSGRPCKHVSFKFNHWSGFDPDFPATLIVRFVDWDKIRHLAVAGVFYILTALWSLAFAHRNWAQGAVGFSRQGNAPFHLLSIALQFCRAGLESRPMIWAWSEPAGALTFRQRHACMKLSAPADSSSLYCPFWF